MHKTHDEILDMSDHEYNLWMGYLTLKAEEAKKAEKKANRKGKGKRTGGF